MKVGRVEGYVVPYFRCEVTKRPLGKLSRNPRVLQKVLIRNKEFSPITVFTETFCPTAVTFRDTSSFPGLPGSRHPAFHLLERRISSNEVEINGGQLAVTNVPPLGQIVFHRLLTITLIRGHDDSSAAPLPT